LTLSTARQPRSAKPIAIAIFAATVKSLPARGASSSARSFAVAMCLFGITST